MSFVLRGTSHYEQSGGANWSGKASLTYSVAPDLIVVVQTGFNSTGTITDTSGTNTYSRLTRQANGGYDVALWYNQGGSYSSGMTFSYSGSDFASIVVYGVSGSQASPFDKESGNNTGSSAQKPGSLTPTNADSWFVTGCVSSNLTAGDLSIDVGFDTAIDNKGTDIQTAGSNFIQSGGPTSKDPTWTSATSSGIRATVMAVFIPSTGGGVSKRPFRINVIGEVHHPMNLRERMRKPSLEEIMYYNQRKAA